MNSPRYKVGQILFVVSSKSTSVIPVQVVEEITKKTLDGEKKTYMVKSGKTGDLHDITRISGEIFDTAKMAKETLTKRSNEIISKIVDNAVSKASELFEDGFESESSSSPFEEDTIEELETHPEEHSIKTNGKAADDGYVLVKRDDGTVERVKLPKVAQA